MLLLQPQSGIEEVRRCIRDLGYCIFDEDMVKEDGKFYSIIKCIRSAGRKSEDTIEKMPDIDGVQKADDLPQRIKDRFGPVLLEKKNPVLMEFLNKRLKICTGILEGIPSGSDRDEMISSIEDIRLALLHDRLR